MSLSQEISDLFRPQVLDHLAGEDKIDLPVVGDTKVA
jgi:hypothetical protein